MRSSAHSSRRSTGGSQSRTRRHSAQFHKVHNYFVGEQLGRGAFSLIYVAYHQKTYRPFAMKLVLKQRLQKCELRDTILFNETVLLPILKHPHIIDIKETIESSRQVMEVMDIYQNGDLANYIDQTPAERSKINFSTNFASGNDANGGYNDIRSANSSQVNQLIPNGLSSGASCNSSACSNSSNVSNESGTSDTGYLINESPDKDSKTLAEGDTTANSNLIANITETKDDNTNAERVYSIDGNNTNNEKNSQNLQNSANSINSTNSIKKKVNRNIPSPNNTIIPSSFSSSNLSGVNTGLKSLNSEYKDVNNNHDNMSFTHLMIIIDQVLSAIEYLHSLHICHRDLKPNNILVGNTSPHVVLTDFGFADFCIEGSPTKLNCGSYGYTAPEILAGQPYDGIKADIWSIGVMIHTIFSKIPPKAEGFNPSKDIDFNLMPTKEVGELLSYILRTNPKKRPTISEIRAHKAFDIIEREPTVPVPDFSQPMFINDDEFEIEIDMNINNLHNLPNNANIAKGEHQSAKEENKSGKNKKNDQAEDFPHYPFSRNNKNHQNKSQNGLKENDMKSSAKCKPNNSNNENNTNDKNRSCSKYKECYCYYSELNESIVKRLCRVMKNGRQKIIEKMQSAGVTKEKVLYFLFDRYMTDRNSQFFDGATTSRSSFTRNPPPSPCIIPNGTNSKTSDNYRASLTMGENPDGIPNQWGSVVTMGNIAPDTFGRRSSANQSIDSSKLATQNVENLDSANNSNSNSNCNYNSNGNGNINQNSINNSNNTDNCNYKNDDNNGDNKVNTNKNRGNIVPLIPINNSIVPNINQQQQRSSLISHSNSSNICSFGQMAGVYSGYTIVEKYYDMSWLEAEMKIISFLLNLNFCSSIGKSGDVRMVLNMPTDDVHIKFRAEELEGGTGSTSSGIVKEKGCRITYMVNVDSEKYINEIDLHLNGAK